MDPIRKALGALTDIARTQLEPQRLRAELNETKRALEASAEEGRAVEAMLAESLKALDAVNAELTEANEAKSLFLGSLAHEVRTPLTAIVMTAEALSDPDVAPLDAGATRGLMRRIVSDGRYLLALIDDLIDLARIEAGRLELKLADVALAGIVDEVVDLVAPAAGEKEVALTAEGADGIVIEGDALRLRQVLTNLVTNAVKFTRPGGSVTVACTAEPGSVAIAVRDTGIGIAPEDVERIFEPFEQASGEPLGGAGLGLAIARRMAELHRGSVAVESTLGEGSTFTVTLPQRKAPATPI